LLAKSAAQCHDDASQCTTVRQSRRAGTLNLEKIAQLDALGFCWTPRDTTRDAAWDKMYAELMAYKEAHGHCNVPQSIGSLGKWCNDVRTRHKKGTLTPEQIVQLDALGFR
jgi:Helicase associated domain